MFVVKEIALDYVMEPIKSLSHMRASIHIEQKKTQRDNQRMNKNIKSYDTCNKIIIENLK